MKEKQENLLDDSKKLPPIIEYKWTTKTKIFIGAIIIFIILLLIILLILLVKAKDIKDEKDDLEKEIDDLKSSKTNIENERIKLINKLEKKNITYIYKCNNTYIFNNIPYADENNLIKNSFKKGGDNFIEELGEINNGLDYEYTDLNIYDLYIPYIAEQKKNEYNKILLYIHGGAWFGGDKLDGKDICENLAELGFISGSLDYTLLNIAKYKNVNIYRIVDEIFAAIKNIKNLLKDEGFNANKLELGIIGGSAGAHLSLLYSYLIKNSPIPVKFVINIYGPVTLEYQFWFKLINLTEPLDNIDQESIDVAKNENKIEKFNLSTVIAYLNVWNGKEIKDNFSEMYDYERDEVKTDNEIYKERFEKAKFAFPIRYVEKDSVPTLCLYGGKDIDVGIGHYSLLKSYFDEKENNNIELFYFKNASHDITADPPETAAMIQQKLFDGIKNYSDNYFSKN